MCVAHSIICNDAINLTALKNWAI